MGLRQRLKIRIVSWTYVFARTSCRSLLLNRRYVAAGLVKVTLAIKLTTAFRNCNILKAPLVLGILGNLVTSHDLVIHARGRYISSGKKFDVHFLLIDLSQ